MLTAGDKKLGGISEVGVAVPGVVPNLNLAGGPQLPAPTPSDRILLPRAPIGQLLSSGFARKRPLSIGQAGTASLINLPFPSSS